ncbi:MAG: c-type cytochrome [Candidatus Hydrogenedentota bacterium]
MKATKTSVSLMLAGLMVSTTAMAAQVTFTKDVLPILQENCQTCHRPGGDNMSGMIAPMSLMDYQETRPWAKAIMKAVENKTMPPWHAGEKFNGHFSNERTLTAEEIATVVAWVKTGAKRGNPADAPAPIEFREGYFMGEPDLVINFNEPFFVKDDVQDLYYNETVTITDEMMPEDKFITNVEFIPGSEVVHHIIAYASDPEAEYITEIGENEDLEGGEEERLRGRTMLGGLAPGTDAGYYPEGFAFPIKQGSEITFAMHYHKEAGPGTGVYDDSTMAMKFATGTPRHSMNFTTIAHGAFEIPPGVDNWVVSGARTFEEDILLLNLFPHTHLRGVASTYTAYYPDGTVEELLETPNYDFNWQEYYYYKEPKLIPAGTRIEVELVYDNSPENAERVGFDSSRAVSFGGPTTDEMDLGWYTYSNAKPDLSD